ncbi:MAG TPA: hypothetical protein VGS28_02735 [Candidatus Saccharimonadales bacterium]|nr:hypothetical protein [Candidatus Saccharimonadales bacterium]
MYSGTTLRNASGNIAGTHQKIDRSARQILSTLLPGEVFPSIQLIIHFEGNNGPDGVKLKSPAQDEPWHYYEPSGKNNKPFLDLVRHHYKSLVEQLHDNDMESAAFQASWLAHALVDGLTPAHHYPYEQELIKLRGEGIETRTSVKDKLFIGGESTFDTLARNWKMWGAKGLMTTHGSFEIGVAMIIAGRRFKLLATPTEEELKIAKKRGIVPLFIDAANEIDSLQMYQNHYRFGWNAKLIKQVRRDLIPVIVKIVVIAWYLAILESKRAT